MVARRLHERPELRPLFEPSGHDPLFAPWTDPRARIGLALDGVLAGLGLDPAALVPPESVPAERWGAAVRMPSGSSLGG